MTPADRLNQFIADGRIVRGKEHGLWRGTDEQGRDTASLLAAFADGIDNASKFPAGIMPGWMVYFTIHSSERGSPEAWPAMIRRYGAAALQWHRLDESAWRRCLAATMIAALRFAGQHDMSGVVYRVRTMWERVAVDDEPSDSEWNAVAKAGWAVWAAMVGVEAEEGTPEGCMAMFANPFPVETKPAWAARRAAEQGPVSAPPMEATMVVSLAVEAWEATRPETAAEAAATAWRALAQEEAKKERTWEAVEELVWTVGLLVAFFAAMVSAWVLALAAGTGMAAAMAASRKWRREAAARGEAAWAAGAAWAPEARVKAAQNTQRVWDYITDCCLSAIEFEIARAA